MRKTGYRRLAKVFLFPLVWTFLGCFFGLRAVLVEAYSGRAVLWDVAIWVSLLEWWGWGVFTVLMLLYYGLLRLKSRRFRWLVLLHAPLSIVVSVVKANLDQRLILAVFGAAGANFGTSIERVFANIVTYWSILGAMVGFRYYQQFRERQLRATQLEAKLLDARLNALKMQLHPHFLFNTLNAVSTLMHRDVDAADRMLARLGELLRLTIDSAEVNEVSLNQELQFLDLTSKSRVSDLEIGSRWNAGSPVIRSMPRFRALFCSRWLRMLCDMELESRPSAVGFEYSLRFGMAVCVSKFKTVVRIAGDL